LRVKCPNEKESCPWTGELRAFEVLITVFDG